MKFPHMLYGGDYNPDQWPEETWLEDAQLMQIAGVNLVSLGIFSWVKLEPRPGHFDFAWLDNLMELLHAHGVQVNLATPTASPPAWMVKLHPDMLPVTAEGVTLWHGARRHYCPHHPHYRQYAIRIATQLASRYANHPALAMWHVDNEYSCHFGECFCDNSAAAFRLWLETRYGSLDKLNHAWGTAFWSQKYGGWQEIMPPRKAPSYPNPTQQLDWKRFSSDSWLACFEDQNAVFKQLTPDVPVTSNFLSFHPPLDQFKFAAREDVVSNDSYPDPFLADWMIHAGMTCDLTRSVGARRPWVLMEQAPSAVNWRQRNANKRPGLMRLGSLQAVARGADGILFFQWRQSKSGAEKHHSGMLPHAGTDSRVWREITALGADLSRLEPLLTSQVQARVAILMDWTNWWALELDSKPSNDLKLVPQLYAYYQALYKRNITVDFVQPDADLSAYSLVIAPVLYLVSDTAVQNINHYVQQGGCLLMSFFSGIVDENEQIRLGGYPAPFRDLLGLRVEEYAPFDIDQTNSLITPDGTQLSASLWADVIQLQGAESLAQFEQDYFQGSPALTRHDFGTGQAYYLGTELSSTGMDWLMDLLIRKTDIQPVVANLPQGVEALRRASGRKSWLFLLNHTNQEQSIPLPTPGQDLLTGNSLQTTLSLPARGVAVIAESLQ